MFENVQFGFFENILALTNESKVKEENILEA